MASVVMGSIVPVPPASGPAHGAEIPLRGPRPQPASPASSVPLRRRDRLKRLRSALVKILGFYKVSITKPSTGFGYSREDVSYFVLMENLFYGHEDISIVYDLKGSRRNRYQQTKVCPEGARLERGAVQWDKIRSGRPRGDRGGQSRCTAVCCAVTGSPQPPPTPGTVQWGGGPFGVSIFFSKGTYGLLGH